MCGLKRGQDLSDAVDHVLKLDTFLLDIVLDFLQITYQLLQQLLLLLEELPLALDLALLLFTQIQRVSQLNKPFIVVLLVIAKEMSAFCC